MVDVKRELISKAENAVLLLIVAGESHPPESYINSARYVLIQQLCGVVYTYKSTPYTLWGLQILGANTSFSGRPFHMTLETDRLITGWTGERSKLTPSHSTIISGDFNAWSTPWESSRTNSRVTKVDEFILRSGLCVVNSPNGRERSKTRLAN